MFLSPNVIRSGFVLGGPILLDQTQLEQNNGIDFDLNVGLQSVSSPLSSSEMQMSPLAIQKVPESVEDEDATIEALLGLDCIKNNGEFTDSDVDLSDDLLVDNSVFSSDADEIERTSFVDSDDRYVEEA